MQCPNCGFDNRPQARFCKTCGQTLQVDHTPQPQFNNQPAKIQQSTWPSAPTAVQSGASPKFIKTFSPSIFALIVLCFFLPFLDISCSGETIETLSGIELAVGKTLKDPAVSSSINADNDRTDAEPLAIAALACGIVGLAVSFAKNIMGTLAATVMGLAGSITTLWLKFKLDSDIAELSKELGQLVQIEYKIGYWLVLLLFLVAVGLNGLLLFIENQRKSNP